MRLTRRRALSALRSPPPLPRRSQFCCQQDTLGHASRSSHPSTRYVPELPRSGVHMCAARAALVRNACAARACVFVQLVGGLCWCISSSGTAVDVDLFYDDELGLGQKMYVR